MKKKTFNFLGILRGKNIIFYICIKHDQGPRGGKQGPRGGWQGPRGWLG